MSLCVSVCIIQTGNVNHMYVEHSSTLSSVEFVIHSESSVQVLLWEQKETSNSYSLKTRRLSMLSFNVDEL